MALLAYANPALPFEVGSPVNYSIEDRCFHIDCGEHCISTPFIHSTRHDGVLNVIGKQNLLVIDEDGWTDVHIQQSSFGLYYARASFTVSTENVRVHCNRTYFDLGRLIGSQLNNNVISLHCERGKFSFPIQFV